MDEKNNPLEGLKKMQELYAKYDDPNVSLVEELSKMRRAEVAQEEAEHDAWLASKHIRQNDEQIMTLLSHQSAEESHYDQDAATYDAFNEENSRIINRTIERILKKHEAHTVLDLTCGTGSQVFWLTERGFDVVGSDINANMLKVAKQKAKAHGLDIRFLKGDMRINRIGTFDAAITIFNAVGHLTKDDFEKAMVNIRENLNSGGLYIFDINNLSYLLHGNNITSLTIDWQKEEGDKIIRCVQYSTIDANGILASYTTTLEKHGSLKPEVYKDAQTLQTYRAEQLAEMLKRSGFEVIEQLSSDGSKFIEFESDSVFVVARKI